MKVKAFIQSSQLRPWDIGIICALLVLSFLPPFFTFQHVHRASDVSKQAILKVEGKIVRTFPLEAGKAPYTYTYESADGHKNVIEVDGARIRIIEASCHDQTCVRRGWLSQAGETPIACLPHQLFITVENSDGSEDGSLIY